MPSNNKYSAHNLRAISKKFDQSGVAGEMTSAMALIVAEELWKSVSAWIDSGNLKFDNQSFNLRDSIGCGVYENGVLVKMFLMEPPKGTPKTYTYHKQKYNADGMKSIGASFTGEPYLNKGVSIVFRCALPYGFFLEHGLGPLPLSSGGNPGKKAYAWWSEGLVPYITKEFKAIRDGYNRH